MARKSTTYKVESNDRDAGKSYLITEMSADRAEWWAFRTLQALAKTGYDVGGFDDMPLAELARAGLKALAHVPPEDAKPLFDEMLATVSVVLPDGATRALRDGDIEEVSTRIKLRLEALTLHLSFFTNGAPPIGA